jgi:hypothetical protein
LDIVDHKKMVFRMKWWDVCSEGICSIWNWIWWLSSTWRISFGLMSAEFFRWKRNLWSLLTSVIFFNCQIIEHSNAVLLSSCTSWVLGGSFWS